MEWRFTVAKPAMDWRFTVAKPVILQQRLLPIWEVMWKPSIWRIECINACIVMKPREHGKTYSFIWKKIIKCSKVLFKTRSHLTSFSLTMWSLFNPNKSKSTEEEKNNLTNISLRIWLHCTKAFKNIFFILHCVSFIFVKPGSWFFSHVVTTTTTTPTQILHFTCGPQIPK